MEAKVQPQPQQILLIEDNADDFELIRRAFKDTPLEVVWAESLSAALERIRRDSFQVILLDLSLPDSWGLATFKAVHAQASTIPIIVLTGLEDERLGLEAVHGGA